MKPKELLRLVWLNITQNKFKTVMTSIGVIVGAATIVMVIAIGKGGQADVADQFKNLNAGAIDISYDGGTAGTQSDTGGGDFPGGDFSGGGEAFGGDFSGEMPGDFAGGDTSGGDFSGEMPGDFAGGDTSGEGFSGEMPGDFAGGDTSGGDFSGEMPGDFAGGDTSGGDFSGEMPGGGADFSGEMPGGGADFAGGDTSGGDFSGERADREERTNQENITLDEDDVEEIETYVDGISAVTISYHTRATVDGGDLEEAESYTIAGVKSGYESVSNLTLSVGSFITDEDDENKEKVCVLGANVAEEIFGSAIEAYGSVIYIDDRMYVVNGVLEAMGTVASGISPDEAVFLPYKTGIKYLVGTAVDPTITVLASDVENVDGVIGEVTAVLADSYPNAEFTFEDAGSKMEAAEASNEILTILLMAMAAIVFVVGGIGIMNVLFVSVRERTNEIGILKAIGCSKRDILLEFLAEAAAISLIGGVIGDLLSLAVTPVVEYLGVRVELSLTAFLLALVFAVGTGTIFGFYPAYKASALVPVDALGAE